MKTVGTCPPLHIKAVLFRKWVTMKRSGKTLLISSLGTLIFCALAIICFYLMRSLMKQKLVRIDFKRYGSAVNRFFMLQNSVDLPAFENIFRELYHADTQKDVNLTIFPTEKEAQETMYELGKELGISPSYGFGLTTEPAIQNYEIEGYTIGPFPTMNIDIFRNTSFTMDSMTTYNTVSVTRIIWRYLLGKKDPDADINFMTIRLLRRLADYVFSNLGPMLISDGLLSMIPLIISPIIVDICGEVRSYMISCTLRLVPYWIGTFILDYCLWLVVTTFVWVLFLACQIQSFLDNVFETWYILAFGGISFLLFCYVISFAFSNPESAARQAFLILIIVQLIPIIVQLIRQYEDNPVWLEYIYSLFPHICMMQAMTFVTARLGIMSESLTYYYTKNDHTRPYFVFIWVDIAIYGIILFLIEYFRNAIQRKKARANFGSYSEFFEEQKAKHPVTQEAKDMADLVHHDDDWAVRIIDVSRLFMNTAGKPIPAVNNVSLGVRKGSLFGFLGANGAGKTTLIRMITSLLPPSAGTIEIEGIETSKLTDPTLLSICPQFNNHLVDELTPSEHFKLYSMVFMLDPETAKEKTEKLLRELELDELKDKPIRELSGGDVRKLAIALCFLGPAQIILLDEPTASLDPVVRHHVHEMLLQYKGEKTFMLCTHLLSEAEFLCDTISIMIKGNVYTVGSPAYLSQKFGTEFKIDVMLTSDDAENAAKCDTFFAKELPAAVLTIKREKARIYSIPASETTLPDLFEKMQEGSEGDNGFSYYTCSSSSLERVFMEIVHMSEGDDVFVAAKPDVVENVQYESKEKEEEYSTYDESSQP